MKIAIIDDSDYKIRDLSSFLSLRVESAEIQIARSFQTGLKLLETFLPDLILLDMSLPTFESPDRHFEGRSRIYGGKDLLAEIEFLNHECKVVIVTQFDRFDDGSKSLTLSELLILLKKQYKKTVLDGVYYNNINDEWKKSLQNILGEIK